LLEAAIDNVQDKVWVDDFCKVKKAHEKEEARSASEVKLVVEEEQKAVEAVAVEQRLEKG
jgi:hypothetical protein